MAGATDKKTRLIKMVIADKRLSHPELQQQALARRLGISESQMSRYLRGASEMPGDLQDKLLVILGIDRVVEQLQLELPFTD